MNEWINVPIPKGQGSSVVPLQVKIVNYRGQRELKLNLQEEFATFFAEEELIFMLNLLRKKTEVEGEEYV